ncbi:MULTISPECIES: type II secretion system F family protein [unclassified Streptomyces]|uniref:type II secretion system F family protein n=1 Tax=unclassified Streptomyces TaxID=2593676 RepID=UPI002DD84336|nr:type II secretion system F family protein [Streptomyces sp. NBC_01795]WSA97742.1 type II secretion system F family protein [Streptomyces sp. NBC_01795]WSS46741.1 type II secretion system F family protein [Streptomyces sp. NBC_01187]WSS47042.1 type II secretion system F family protein [Streptomyces sp. NBC_01187]
MNTSALVLGCGMGLGLALLVRALMPARPGLGQALQPPSSRSARGASGGYDRDEVWGQWVMRRLSGMPGLKLPVRELELLGTSPAKLILKKAALAGMGFMWPWLFLLPPMLIGLPMPFFVPGVFGLGTAALAWIVPDLEVRAKAKRARREFAYAMAAYLDLIALQRGADSGPTEALARTAKVADGWAFRRVDEALMRAQVEKIPPWQALRELTRELDLPALDDVADIMRQSSHDGAAVADTLRKRAASLSTQLLEEQTAEANSDSEKMTAPISVVAVLLMFLMGFPAVLRILTIGG